MAAMVVQLGMLAAEALRDSPTVDEFGHMAAGLDHWNRGCFDHYRVNPPLIRLIATFPVWLAADTLPRPVNAPENELRCEFQLGSELVSSWGTRTWFYFAIARLMVIGIPLLGTLAIYAWTREVAGDRPAIVAAILWCFSPTIIGHGHLITADVGAATLGLLANYAWWKVIQRPLLGRCLACGLLLGAAIGAKSTWLILVPLWPVVAIGVLLVQSGRLSAIGLSKLTWSARLRLLGQSASRCSLIGVSVSMMAILVLNAIYAFDETPTDLSQQRFVSELVRDRIGTPQTTRIVPLPRDFVLGIDQQEAMIELPQTSYLRGQWRASGGWWYYYLYCLAVKEPLGIAAGLALSALTSSTLLRQPPIRAAAIFWLTIAAGVFATLSMHSNLNGHYRYAALALPYLYMGASLWASELRCSKFAARNVCATKAFRTFVSWTGSLATVAVAISSLAAFPNHISYFHELAGGGANGHMHLLGSNVDWGQDMYLVNRWIENHPHARPVTILHELPAEDLAWAGPGCATAIGHERHLFGFQEGRSSLQGGWYIISVNRALNPIDRAWQFHPFPIHDRIGDTNFVIQVTAGTSR